MANADEVLASLRRAGFGLVTGVPCSYLTPVINAAIDGDDLRYVGATNEGDAVAIAAGAHLAGTRSVVMFQNSGFGNAVNPLSSLTHTHEIPVLVLVTWRGHPEQPADEPQHDLMGRITPDLLDALEIPWTRLPADDGAVDAAIQSAAAEMARTGRSYAFIVEKGTVEDRPLASQPDLDAGFQLAEAPPARPAGARHDADDVLRLVQRVVGPGAVVIATTGFTGRALYALEDRSNQLYMVGSMGCASSLGLGVALAAPDRRVVVLDGDGALLMRMGALATIGAERPSNLVHVLLDNAVHDSTGAQATVAPSIDPVAVAAACGYPRVARIDDLDDLAPILESGQQLSFAHVRTRPRADRKLPRPTVTPAEVAARLAAHIGGRPA